MILVLMAGTEKVHSFFKNYSFKKDNSISFN